jgi:hypothetical protein
MLVEHSFVTTLDEAQVYRQANEFLLRAGFSMEGSLEADSVVYQRGKKKGGFYKHFAELPQRVHIGFDRGRVNLAASIHESGKVHQAHRDMVLGIVTGLEKYIVGSVPLPDAGAAFAAAGLLADKEFRRRRTRKWIMLAFLAVLILLLFLLVVVAIAAR